MASTAPALERLDAVSGGRACTADDDDDANVAPQSRDSARFPHRSTDRRPRPRPRLPPRRTFARTATTRSAGAPSARAAALAALEGRGPRAGGRVDPINTPSRTRARCGARAARRGAAAASAFFRGASSSRPGDEDDDDADRRDRETQASARRARRGPRRGLGPLGAHAADVVASHRSGRPRGSQWPSPRLHPASCRFSAAAFLLPSDPRAYAQPRPWVLLEAARPFTP